MPTLAYDPEQRMLRLLDQTRLPAAEVYLACHDHLDVAEAIRTMRVRGAPAIGVAAAYGVALGALTFPGDDPAAFLAHLEAVVQTLRQTRPTAVNLGWALDRALTHGRAVTAGQGVADARQALVGLADAMAEEDVAVNRRMAAFGLDLVPQSANVLTHCNTGALATVDYGTALGVIRAAHEAGRALHVFVDETRPYLQGARLTAWELKQLGVPKTLITDNMAGHFMSRGQVDMVFVGADRIATNGDVANKIGTYSLAVLAHAHDIPFYVVAPTSTIDLSLASGAEIPIEERSAREVLELNGQPIAPLDVRAAHPAFDVTPNRLVTAIVTEQGIVRAPYEPGLRAAVDRARAPAAVA
jgi:methylthioribose-1-phosphate isomerase